MKKTKKALASLAIAGMALTTVPFNALADNAAPATRLAGTTAEQTAVQIAEQMAPTSGIAILASSASYGASDALTAGPLAAFVKGPILLQGPEATLNADTQAELTKLKVTKVYVTSGTAVIKQSVLDQLAGMGISVESLGGADRFETSVNIAKKMVALGAPVKKVAVAYGWLNQDALSIAAIASAGNEPIILTEKAGLSASAKAFLAANPSITASDVIGGTGVIADSVLAQLPSPTRHFGNTAYDTNNQVIQDFASSLKFDDVYLANGKTGIDALAGAPLAAMTNSPIVLTDGANVPAAAAFVHGKMSATGVVTALGGAAVVSDSIRTGVASGQPTTTAPQGTLAVTSVAAASATSIKVVFNQAPADTTKIAFSVTNTGAPFAVTTTWSDDKTTATLTSSANFPEGTYVVGVKNDQTDLGSSNVSITQQKIAKININSTKLAVVTVTTGTTSTSIGYATFTVLDQYGNDITNGYLANNINWQCGVGSVTVPTKGVLKVTPPTNGTNLLTYTSIVITGSDNTSGVSASANLNTSTAMGTLSSITLNKLTSANNAVFKAGDTSDTWYIDYTALDMSGNPTKDYSLVYNGLINTTLSCSNPNVTAKVVQDPSDSNKAAIKVQVTNGTVQMDMPCTITAMPYQGASSSLNLTLKKQSTLDTFTLMAPSYSIASSEYKQIPFVAYDQDGTQLTKYSDLTGQYAVQLSGGAKLVQNPDGTASVWVQANPATGSQSVPQIITAVTSTGKLSSLTLNIQTVAKADKLSLDDSVLVTSMQAPTSSSTTNGAIERVDFGYNYGGLAVKDQYGRDMDFTSLAEKGDGTVYKVVASVPDTSIITLDSTDRDGNVLATNKTSVQINSEYTVSGNTYGGTGVQIRSVAPGQQTVTFSLVDVATGNVIDTKTETFSVLKNTDIKNYTIDKVANPIYTDATTIGAITAKKQDYEANPYVWGTTAGGGKVVLAQNAITGAYVDSGDFFVDTTNSGSITNADNHQYDGVFVAAKTLDASKTGSSTTLTVTIQGADGLVHTVTTPITSSTTDPVAKSLNVSLNQTTPGVSMSDDKTTVTVTVGSEAAADLSAGKYLTRFISSTGGKNRAVLYFYAKDSYGTKAMDLASVGLVSNTDDLTATGNTLTNAKSTIGTFTLDQYGKITQNTLQAGDYVTVTAVTTSGLVQTIKIVYK